MRVHLCSVPKNGIYPARICEEFVREEETYRGHKRVEVEREYVRVLQYNPSHEAVLPATYFKKDVGEPYLVVADDLHSHLAQKRV